VESTARTHIVRGIIYMRLSRCYPKKFVLGLKKFGKQFECWENAAEHGQSHQDNLWCNACCLTNAANPSRSMRNPRISPEKSGKKSWVICHLTQVFRTKVSGEKNFYFLDTSCHLIPCRSRPNPWWSNWPITTKLDIPQPSYYLPNSSKLYEPSKSKLYLPHTLLWTHFHPAMPFGNRKIYFQRIFLSQFIKYHPSGSPKFNNLGNFLSLKSRILMEKILPVSLKLNFTPQILWAVMG